MLLVIWMNTIKNNITNEITVNKSKFITCLYNVNNILDAKLIINNIKDEYKGATHYCYSYIIGNVKRFSDDKEPNGTAGMPILNILESNQLNNVLAIVVRYFGGVKLGANNLLRTYGNSVSKALLKAGIVPLLKEYKQKIEFSYDNVNNINYLLKNYLITYKEFDKNIIYEFIYNENNYPKKIDKYIIKRL